MSYTLIKTKIIMKKIIFLFASLIAFGSAKAQLAAGQGSHSIQLTIPSVALVKVSGGNPSFAFGTPGTAGLNLADVTSTGTSLQYTSIATGTTVRTIYVTATSTGAALTGGLNLSVLSDPTPAVNGTTSNGNLGVAAAVPSYITKSAAAAVARANTGIAIVAGDNQKLITGITSGYTGVNAGDGPILTYTASVGGVAGATLPPVVAADYEKIRSGVYSFTVYYTLADNL
jgi:hypothetical protein